MASVVLWRKTIYDRSCFRIIVVVSWVFCCATYVKVILLAMEIVL